MNGSRRPIPHAWGRQNGLGRRAAAVLVAGVAIAGCTAARAAQTSTTTTTTTTTSTAQTTTTTTAPARPKPPVTTTSKPTTSKPTTTSSTTTITISTTPRPTTTAPNTTAPTTSTTTATTTEPTPTTTEPPATTIPETTSTTIRPIEPVDGIIGDVPLPHLGDAFHLLAAGNAAVSLSVWRDQVPIFGRASGATNDGMPMTSDSPMVLASVSKLITALTIARLAENGLIDVSAPVPWDRIGLAHDPAWNDVTVRELLDHTSGMPKAQSSWLNEPGSCAIPLTDAVLLPPRTSRGQWVYSNGNYCALGLLIEAITGAGRDSVADLMLFAPIGVTGPHLSTDGTLPGDAPHAKGVARLERLGGAGTWLASTADVAAMLASVTAADLQTLQFPGIMSDQYGWGHTGTVDGAKACAWVLEGGRTVVVAAVAGDRPSTGGRVCDVVEQSLALDLGIWTEIPVRLPD